MRIYKNKIQNGITLKITRGYYLELLTPETIQLLGSTEKKIDKNKMDKNKNGENAAHLEITEVLLVPCCNIASNIINTIQEPCLLLDISTKNFIILKTFNSVFLCCSMV